MRRNPNKPLTARENALIRNGAETLRNPDGGIVAIIPKKERQANEDRTRSSQAGQGATLSLAQPDQFDENGALIVKLADGSEQRTQVIGITERGIIDAIPILQQGNIIVAL